MGMNWQVGETRKACHLEEKGIWYVQGSRDGSLWLQRRVRWVYRAGQEPGQIGSCRLCHGFSLYPPNNRSPSTGFSHGVTWSDLCFKKITWAARREWICREPTMDVANQSVGYCRDPGKRGGWLRLKKMEVGIIYGVHVWMWKRGNDRSNYCFFPCCLSKRYTQKCHLRR